MLIDTKDLIKKLEIWIANNPQPYDSDNIQLMMIIRAENKLCRKFIMYLESLG